MEKNKRTRRSPKRVHDARAQARSGTGDHERQGYGLTYLTARQTIVVE